MSASLFNVKYSRRLEPHGASEEKQPRQALRSCVTRHGRLQAFGRALEDAALPANEFPLMHVHIRSCDRDFRAIHRHLSKQACLAI